MIKAADVFLMSDTGISYPKAKFWQWVSECPTQHIIGHFGDKSFQAINCTGTDNQKQSNTTLHTATALANKTIYTWFGMPFTTSGQETEWALFLQPRSPHGALAVTTIYQVLILPAPAVIIYGGCCGWGCWNDEQRNTFWFSNSAIQPEMHLSQ